MKLSVSDLKYLNTLAIQAARDASNYIYSKFDAAHQTNHKTAGDSYASQVFTEVDLKSQEIILQHLAPTQKQYDIGLLTEEAVDDNSRFKKDYFWCIDPLDGSLPFIEKKDGFAVSIALVSKDGVPYIGVIMDPTTDTLYSAIKGHGVKKNNTLWNIESSHTPDVPLTLVCDRSFLKHPNYSFYLEKLKSLADKLHCSELEVINHGGAVMNAIWVLENSPACYFKLPKKSYGGGSLWDYAATSCLYNELQLPATKMNGTPLDLNPEHTTFMNKQGILYTSMVTLHHSLLNLTNNKQ